MDKIYLERLHFYAYHGVLPQEKTEGQDFYVSLTLYCDLAPAGRSDDLKDTVDYGAVYEKVRKITLERRFDLIEALAEEIAGAILTAFGVAKVSVRVDKPKAPGTSAYFPAAVEIERTR